MTDPEPVDPHLPLSQLPAQEKARRSGSFGAVASHYGRYRPGPPPEAVNWILPTPVGTVVDLGAGTGALTRLLTDRAAEVIAVEPDDRMRSVLVDEVPGISAVKGRGEAIPVPDASVDAVLASASWHWMDPVATLAEVSRILTPGGILGVLWSGPDPEGAFLVRARTILSDQFATVVMGDAFRPAPSLEIPSGFPFDRPETQVFRWDVALDADALIGLLGTFSRIITMPEENRRRLIDEARRLLGELLAVEGEVTVDVTFRSAAWRSRRLGDT